jgi:tetratricopeptide (TPR) repeat protein
MAKKNFEQTEENLANIEQAISKTEKFVENNKKNLSYGVVALFAIVFVVLGYNKYIRIPSNEEAYSSIWHAEQYFAQDSLEWALNGYAENPGFLDIIDDYGSTPSGNLAQYYTGICYFRLAQQSEGEMANDYYAKAIDYLENFDSEDINVKPMAIGAIGDCKMELGKPEKAVSLYLEAARLNDNEFVTPLFLQKAAITYSFMGKHKKALALFEEIQANYPRSNESNEIKKYIAREESYLNK